MNIGRNLTILLYDKGIKAKELAKKIGVTPGMISKIKRGEREPSTANLVKIADYFGVTVDELIK